MNTNISVLDSEYIIDGARMDLTPRQILVEAMGMVSAESKAGYEPIVDESVDPSPSGNISESKDFEGLLDIISVDVKKRRQIPAYCPESVTRGEIARALVDTVWKKGHFRLDDLALNLVWEWNPEPVGNMSAFYRSVESACSYLDMLGVRISGYGFVENSHGCSIRFKTSVEGGEVFDDEDASSDTVDIAESIDRDIRDLPENNSARIQLWDIPFRTENPVLKRGRCVSSHVITGGDNWLIYIPFDTCNFRLGASLVAEKSGVSGGKAPDMSDSDYFIDCFEVVREFVEDGIILSGATVSAGGIITTLDAMKTAEAGIDVDLSAVLHSYSECSPAEVLFGEVAGVIVEIRDSDFDYVDAELLLQDVAYYPIGHPGVPGLRITENGPGNLAGILQSLLGQEGVAAEGED